MLQAGGLRCSYSAGVLCAIAETYGICHPDILVGSSGSTGSLAYYLAGQYRSIQNIWTNLLTAPKFISWRRIFKIMDIDYLIDVVFKQQEPLDIEKIYNSNSRLFISTTRYQDGKLKFFTNKDDVFEALRASKAIPMITGKKVIIRGTEYVDGSISTSFDINIQKAIEEGAKNIIVIKDSEGVSFVTKVLYYLYSFFVNKKMKGLLKTHCTASPYQIKFQENINMIVISPSKELKFHPLDNKKEHLSQSFFLGYNDLRNSNEFKAFISSL